MLKPLNPKSESYSDEEFGIQYVISQIKRGHGNYEPDFEDNKRIKTAHLPLVYFNGYLEKGKYPHPTLLAYISQVFQQILDGAKPEHAMGLKRAPGRPSNNDDSELRNQRSKMGLSVYFKVHKVKNPIKLKQALRDASKKYCLSVEAVEKAYYNSKKEYEMGVKMGEKYGRNK